MTLPIYNNPDEGSVGGVPVTERIPVPIVSFDGATQDIAVITEAQRLALSPPDAHTLYVIVG